MQFQGKGVESLVCICMNDCSGVWLLNMSLISSIQSFYSFFVNISIYTELFNTGYCSRLWLRFSLFQDLRVLYSRSTNHVETDFCDLAGQTAWPNAAPTSAQTRKGRRKVEYLETLRKYSLADFLLNLNLVNCVGFNQLWLFFFFFYFFQLVVSFHSLPKLLLK